jgi:bifunctional non-homologous end joining protein LigD
VDTRHGARPNRWQKYTAAGIAVSHPDKIWWPDEGITKLDVVRYYADVENHLRPWMKDRLLTAERCPEGMRGACFYQKNFDRGLPPGVPTEAVRAETTRRVVHYVVGGARRTLLALVNLGCIPIHLMNCRRGALDRPDWLAFDLDPGSERFADAARAGLVLQQILDDLGLRSYPKNVGRPRAARPRSAPTGPRPD